VLSHLQTLFFPALVSSTLLASSPARGEGEDPPRSYVVGKVSIQLRQVFDESDTTFFHDVERFSEPAAKFARTLGRLANDVHVPTREEVIQQELLFKEGDPYNQRLVDESGRHLRRLGFIGGVHITSDTLPDCSINVTIHARDVWTLSPTMSVRAGGGVSGFGVGLREENLLGTGQKVRIGYNRLSDRTHPDGGEISFTEPRLWGSWWNISGQYRRADELSVSAIDVGRPFYTDATEWAVRGYAGVGDTRIRQYQDGLVVRDDYLHEENEFLWLGTSSGDETKLQFAGAYYRVRSRFDSMQVRPFDNVDLVIASVSLQGRDYYRGSYIENFGRTEDVPIGYQAGVAIGRNLHLTDRGSVDYFMRVIGQVSWRSEAGISGNYRATFTSYLAGTTPEEMTISASAQHFWRVLPNQTLLGRIATTIGSHWSPSSQVTLGAFSGLRGYRNDEFVGERLLVMNLEHRMFSLVKLWFFRLGTSLFFDTGMAWNRGEGFYGHRFHSAAGVGLQIESGKNYGAGIFRFDIAYNMDQHRIALSLSSDHLFRAFSNIEFVQPIPGAEVEQRTRY
jgi:hypothetical protein